MIGLVAAYFIGKDVAHKQSSRRTDGDDVANGFKAVVGCGAVLGSVIGAAFGGSDGAGNGFLWGIGIGLTLWLLVAAFCTEKAWVVVLAVTVLGGTWSGGLIGGADGFLNGLLLGGACWIGWLVAQAVRWFFLTPAEVKAERKAEKKAAAASPPKKRPAKTWEVDQDALLQQCYLDRENAARWLYQHDAAHRANVDAIKATDPLLASELSGGLT